MWRLITRNRKGCRDLRRGGESLWLAIELKIESEQAILQGAISTGNIWQFGQFDRHSREVTQDLDLYRVPADLEDLLRIIVRILQP